MMKRGNSRAVDRGKPVYNRGLPGPSPAHNQRALEADGVSLFARLALLLLSALSCCICSLWLISVKCVDALKITVYDSVVARGSPLWFLSKAKKIKETHLNIAQIVTKNNAKPLTYSRQRGNVPSFL